MKLNNIEFFPLFFELQEEKFPAISVLNNTLSNSLKNFKVFACVFFFKLKSFKKKASSMTSCNTLYDCLSLMYANSVN